MPGHKLVLAVVVVQSIYAGYFLLSKIAFDVGMNPLIFVFYRQAIATLFLAPIALFFEWKTAPWPSFVTSIKIFMLSLFGITTSLDCAGIAIKYTSASLAAATTNTVPVLTFWLAVLLRMEKLNIRTMSGIIKVIGVLFCMGGVATIAFYNGPYLKLLARHHQINTHLHKLHNIVPSTKTWIKGTFLMLLANLSWSSWIILQVRMLMNYHSKLLLMTLQCFFSTIQALVIAIVFVRDPSQWKLGLNFRLIAIAYCGMVVTGITFYLQAWIIEKKGPVFLAMTTPLLLVFTIIISIFILGDIVTLGSLLGAILLVGGLYLVLWGKTKEGRISSQPNGGDMEKGCGHQSVNP